jgi:hypothetical protein
MSIVNIRVKGDGMRMGCLRGRRGSAQCRLKLLPYRNLNSFSVQPR